MEDRPKNFLLILYEIGSNHKKELLRVQTSKYRRFLMNLKQLQDYKSMPEAYIRVGYTQGGKNEGFYDNFNDLMFAFEAFVEK